MIFWLLWPLFLFAETEPNYALSTFGGEPEGIVAGCVNPMVGEYFVQADELVVNCARPIILKRMTESRGAIDEHGRWHFVPHLRMTFSDRKACLKGKDPSGASVEYVSRMKLKGLIGMREMKPSSKYFVPVSFLKGFTNSSQGVISGRNHIKNHRIVKRKGKFTLFTEDGVKREYHKAKREKNRKKGHYYLFQEEFPNNDYIRYFYDKLDTLTRIESGHLGTNIIYGHVGFDYQEGILIIHTSDHQKLVCDGQKYDFKDRQGDKETRFLYNRFIYNGNGKGAEKVSYSHDGLAFPKSYQMSLKHHQQIDYYSTGKHELSLHGDKITMEKGDRHYKKVLRLKAPAGHTHELQTTHEFLYHDNTRTDLFTPNGHCRAFRYNQETRRPYEIEFYDNSSGGINNVKVKYHWSDLGYLIKKEVFSPVTHCLSSLQLTYDDKGNVIRESIHADGLVKTTHYEYGNRSRLTKKIHPNGLTEIFTYNDQDQLICYEPSQGPRVTYHYGARHRLTEVITEGAKKRIKRTTYHDAPHCRDLPFVEEEFYEEEGCRHLLSKQVIHYDDRLLVFQVDHFDRENTLLFSLEREYDSLRRLISETDPLGRKRHLSYDEAGNLITETKFDSPLTYHYTYDGMRRVIAVTETAPDGSSRTIQTRYDLENNAIEKIDMRGHSTFMSYDGHGNVILEKTPDGAITRRIYNHQKQPLKVVDPLGGETIATYNAAGQITSTTYPNGAQEFKTYTATALLASHTLLSGNTIYFSYDLQNRLLSKKTYDSSATLLSEETFTYNSTELLSHTTPSGTTTYTYDAAGRKASETFRNVTTTYTYDACGRIYKEQTGPRYKITLYDLLGRPIQEETNDTTTYFHYDRYDQLTTTITTSPAGPAIKHTDYDHYGRPVAQRDALGNQSFISYRDLYNTPTTTLLEKTSTDARGTKRIEIYTPQGKVASLRLIDWLGNELLEEIYTYDLMGNKMIQESHLPTQILTTHWTYNSLGELIELNEPQNRTTRFVYDKAGRRTHLFKPGGVILETTYDALSRPIRLISSDGTISYTNTYNPAGLLLTSNDLLNTYDPFGNLISESYHNLTNTFTYDDLHRRTSMTLPTQETISYTYNETHLASVQFRDLIHTYHYNQNRLSYEELPYNLGQVSYTYNPLLPLSITSPYHEQTIHTLDASNNITSITTNSTLSSYSYDPLSQIVSESGPFEHTYHYDAHYRRLQKDSDDHSYDELNQLLSRLNHTYTYTPTGCRATCNETTYTYDALDRLISITTPSTRHTFTYDYFNRLITLDGDTLLYDGENEIGRFANNIPIELRILGAPSRSATLNATIGILLMDKLYIPLHDLYGNITHLMTPRGTLIHTSLFNPFGEERRTGLSLNPWRYQSKRHIGPLVYFGERFYDINTGLFLSPDPMGFHDGPNLYQYVHNNPLSLIDPDGAMILTPPLIFPKELFKPSSYTNLGPCYYAPNFEKLMSPIPNNYNINESCSYSLNSTTDFVPVQKELSRVNTSSLKDPARGPITSINGMGCSLRDSVENNTYASKLFGHNIYSVYNATHGAASDLVECMLGSAGIATPPALLLTREWQRLFSEISPSQELFHVCHSQGAIHTKLALLLLPPEQRSRIHVMAIAPAAYIPNELCKSAVNYAVQPNINKNPETQTSKLCFDVVPLIINYPARALAHIQYVATPERLRQEPYTYNVKFLKSHPDAPSFDHAFTSPTYADSIKGKGDRFIQGLPL
jgi:RHS repeat-associated protein